MVSTKSVERVVEELSNNVEENCTWIECSTLAAIYVQVNQFEKAEAFLRKLESAKMPRKHEAYHSLISLYAGYFESSRGDLLEEAELVFDKAMKRCKGPFAISWERFKVYYLKKLRIDLALKRMEAAVSENWSPYPETIAAFFDYFLLILPSNSAGF
ncbi:hypothetical protein Gorai_009537 [Gossypium raimondii]|uniref:Uncharacterized protein n=1 Tax=Gossypium raimondii TaxID=29730 RepID=A0A7J8PTH7_GOSRA|nr:hypothetical protein [Gossypium raimondii]